MAARRPAPTPPTRRGAARRPARRPRRTRRRLVLGWLLGLLVAGLALAVGGFAAAYALVKVPDPNELADAQISTVYYADGTTELGTFAAVNRENVSLDQVPEPVQKAVLAAEDRSFYENRGVSPTGIARALWSNVSDGTSQGGSTLTQQYVKNYYLSGEHSYTRKAKEFFISLKIDQQQTKDQTLENYLNTVYFGRGAYGVQAASQAYFGIDSAQLDVSQGALLAALLKGPSNYDPRKGETQAAAAQARVGYVLDGMVTEGWLAPADRAAAGLPDTIEPQQDDQWSGTKGYLLKTVKDELSGTVGLSDDDIDRGGLKITTTFDAKAQAAAEKAVADQLPAKRPEGFHVALSAIDPKTGGVSAMYGGADFETRTRQRRTQATAQAGSTFKPFTLVAALEQGISLRTTFNGSSPRTIEDWPARNFGDEQFGRIDLVTATEHSVNTVYGQLNEEVTPEKTREVAIRMGYPRNTRPGGREHDHLQRARHRLAAPHRRDPGLRDVRGAGHLHPGHTIAAVDEATGTRTYTASPTTQQAFDRDVAGRRHVRHGAGRAVRHRLLRRASRPARRGQDGHHQRQQVGLVRRVHPEPRRLRRPLPDQPRRQDAASARPSAAGRSPAAPTPSGSGRPS